MSFQTTDEAKPKRKKKRFPWLALLILLASLYVFVVIPYTRRNSGPVQVEFVNPSK